MFIAFDIIKNVKKNSHFPNLEIPKYDILINLSFYLGWRKSLAEKVQEGQF